MIILTSFEHLKPIKTDRNFLVVSGSLYIMSGSRLEWLLPVTCHLLPVTCYLLPVTCYLLPDLFPRISSPDFPSPDFLLRIFTRNVFSPILDHRGVQG